MWAGAVLCFVAYGLDTEDPSNVNNCIIIKLYLGIALGIVSILTGTITFFQNEKSEAIMDAFKNFIPPECSVIRDG